MPKHCAGCSREFPSGNALFRHLKETGCGSSEVKHEEQWVVLYALAEGHFSTRRCARSAPRARATWTDGRLHLRAPAVRRRRGSDGAVGVAQDGRPAARPAQDEIRRRIHQECRRPARRVWRPPSPSAASAALSDMPLTAKARREGVRLTRSANAAPLNTRRKRGVTVLRVPTSLRYECLLYYEHNDFDHFKMDFGCGTPAP